MRKKALFLALTVGSIFLVSGFWTLGNTAYLKYFGLQTTGVITGFHARGCPIIKFSALEEEIIYHSKSCGLSGMYKIGDPISVAYNPKNPANSPAVQTSMLGGLMFSFLGLLSLGVSYVIFRPEKFTVV